MGNETDTNLRSGNEYFVWSYVSLKSVLDYGFYYCLKLGTSEFLFALFGYDSLEVVCFFGERYAIVVLFVAGFFYYDCGNDVAFFVVVRIIFYAVNFYFGLVDKTVFLATEVDNDTVFVCRYYFAIFENFACFDFLSLRLGLFKHCSELIFL